MPMRAGGLTKLARYGLRKQARTSPLVQKARRDQQQVRELSPEEVINGRSGLTNFCVAVDPNSSADPGGGYRADHLRLIAEKLEAVERGEIKRLMVFLPPRHWKSSLCSEKFPAYYLGKHPERMIIHTSYNSDLASDFSEKVRDMIGENPAYAEIFPGTRLKRARQRTDTWALSKGYRSSYRAAGIRGGVTGRGANLIIVDDPVRGPEDVATKHLRDTLYKWYTEKLRTRLEPNGAIIVIMTRWHEDDLAGRLLKAQIDGGEQWTIVSLPAYAEPNFDPFTNRPYPPIQADGVTPNIIREIDDIGRRQGDLLWPEKFDAAEYEGLRISVGARGWAAQYQQRPRQESGNILNSDRVRMINADEVPFLTMRFRAWDLAFSERLGSDFLSGGLGGTDGSGNLYVVHVKRLSGAWPINKPKIVEISQIDGPNVVVSIEANGTQLGYYQDVKADEKMRRRRVIPYRPEGNKEMRASLWGGHLNGENGELGKIFIVRGEWNLALFDEMDDFPNAEHDDMVDCISQLWWLVTSKRFAGLYSQ